MPDVVVVYQQETVTVQATQVATVESQGAVGPAGPSGAGAFVYTQSSPASSVAISHGFGRYVSVALYTLAGVQFDTDVVQGDPNTVTVIFPSPQTFIAVIT